MKYGRTLPTLALLAAATLTSGCSMLGIGGLDEHEPGETVEMPAGAGETDAVVEVTITSMEEAPAEVAKTIGDGTEVWYTQASFELGSKELQEHDWDAPWDEVAGYLDDGTVIEMVGGAANDLEGCAIDDEQWEKLVADYAAGDKVEVCVPVFGDGSAPLAGAFFGPTSTIEAGAAWVK